GSVTTAKLADAAVTTAKLADKSVTPAKQNSGAASSGFVLTADGAGGAQYQSLSGVNGVPDGSVVNASVAANAGIQYSKLNLSNSIVSGDIKDNTIVNSDISATAAIAYAKLNLANSITTSDIKLGTIDDVNVSPTAAI